MKLRNKKTGEIIELLAKPSFVKRNDDYLQSEVNTFDSLAEINEEWEDYEEPKEKRWYWCVDYITCGVDHLMYDPDDPDQDEFNESIGNYFETEEEAKKAVEKLKAAKRLKDNGFKIKGWKFTPDMKHIEGNYVKIEAEIPQILINEKDINLLFGGEE